MRTRKWLGWIGIAAAGAVPLTVGVAATAVAGGLSGAIFTTVADGSEVNYNIYPSKDAVYLDGGPGPGAPQGAAGLPDGNYYFQVTDPSGKTLLSSDGVACREFTVSAGIITGLVDNGCNHVTGSDIDHGATTVQLMPYADTPNHGNEYKVWVTPVANYSAGSGVHGFIPRYSKTDNYKVGGSPIEIDTRFFPAGAYGAWIDGLAITHTDTLGATNMKWSYLDTSLDINHEAHVEDAEVGTHYITVANQPGCTVGHVLLNGSTLSTVGPQTVAVTVKNSTRVDTLRVDIECQ